MMTAKATETFCTTRYKKWLVLLAAMVIILIVWVAIGFDEDKAQGNLSKIQIEADHRFGGDNAGDGRIELSRLQESYSDIATKVRAVTVNISASRNAMGMGGNNGGIEFADPFGVQPQRAIGGTQNVPGVMSVKAIAPPITQDAKMPHTYRGVCSNCHPIINNKKKGQQAARQAAGMNRASVGSGVIIDASGYILTNNHIIENANNIIVTTISGSKYRAEVKFSDAGNDLAILKINSAAKFPAAVLGNSDIIQEGDIVLAVGNPFGLNQTVTSGIISDSNRSVNIGGAMHRGLIQTDAAINRGSSGGPLVNIKGEVIGINSAIYSMTGDFTGIGFAIPINRAKETFTSVPAIQAMQANFIDMNVGEVITIAMRPNLPEAWFGAEVSAIDPIIAEQFGLRGNNGVIVNRIFPGSPAEKAGLVRGDIILKVNGRRVTDINKYKIVTSSLQAGDPISLSINRNGGIIKPTALLENIQNRNIPKRTVTAAAVAPGEMEWAGMEVTPITPILAKRYGIAKGTKGVVVIEAEAMAAASGIFMGDVIHGINRQEVKSMSDFVSATMNANIAEGVLFDISRQGDPLFITM